MGQQIGAAFRRTRQTRRQHGVERRWLIEEQLKEPELDRVRKGTGCARSVRQRNYTEIRLRQEADQRREAEGAAAVPDQALTPIRPKDPAQRVMPGKCR